MCNSFLINIFIYLYLIMNNVDLMESDQPLRQEPVVPRDGKLTVTPMGKEPILIEDWNGLALRIIFPAPLKSPIQADIARGVLTHDNHGRALSPEQEKINRQTLKISGKETFEESQTHQTKEGVVDITLNCNAAPGSPYKLHLRDTEGYSIPFRVGKPWKHQLAKFRFANDTARDFPLNKFDEGISVAGICDSTTAQNWHVAGENLQVQAPSIKKQCSGNLFVSAGATIEVMLIGSAHSFLRTPGCFISTGDDFTATNTTPAFRFEELSDPVTKHEGKFTVNASAMEPMNALALAKIPAKLSNQ